MRMIWVRRKDGAWARSTAPDGILTPEQRAMSPKDRLLCLLPFRSLTAAMDLAEAFDEGPEGAPAMGPDDMAEWIFELEDEEERRQGSIRRPP